jgi:dUTP pyrophosphatase
MIRYALMNDDFMHYFPPSRKHDDDVGIDLYYNDREVITIPPGGVEVVHTKTKVEIPMNCFGWITNKSGKNYLVGAGIIDQGYQGELLVKIFNPTDEQVYINYGDAIAQLIIMAGYYDRLSLVPENELFEEETMRGSTGGIHG